MLHYLFLSIYTIIILFLGYKIWKKTKNVGFILGIFFLYYWSLLGAWFIILDSLTNQIGKEFGLAYYHYLEILFPVNVDNSYLIAISLYALFIITIEGTVLFFTNPKPENNNKKLFSPIEINHKWLLITCFISTLLSFVIIYEEILIAANFNESVYYVTRNYHGRFYIIHQLLNQVAVASIYIGLIVFISKEKGSLLIGSTKTKYVFLYLIVIFILEAYLLFIGNKREILFGGILGVLFYLSNVNYKIQLRPFATFIIIIAIPLTLNDGLRGLSPTFLAEKNMPENIENRSFLDNFITSIFDLSKVEFSPDEKITYTAFSAKNTIFRFLFSNEMFVPHFSMYGVISHDIPLTYGSSLKSLSASMVPRFIWPNRPEPVYNYYASQVNAKVGTGYTIHHASAWYLNFGVIGVFMGAFIFGGIWSFLYNKSLKLEKLKTKFIQLFYTIAICAFVAQIPGFIRSGPEGYKALFFEALLFPVLALYCTSLFNLLKKKA